MGTGVGGLDDPRFSINSLRAISNKGTPKGVVGMYCASVSTQPWESPLQPESSEPLFAKLLLSDVSNRIHQRAQQGTCFPPKMLPSTEGCLEGKGTFLLLLTYFSESH